jgi:hypothetical protein
VWFARGTDIPSSDASAQCTTWKRAAILRPCYNLRERAENLSGAAARFVFVVGAVDGLDNRVIAVRAERVLDGGDVAVVAVGRELDAPVLSWPRGRTPALPRTAYMAHPTENAYTAPARRDSGPHSTECGRRLAVDTEEDG